MSRISEKWRECVLSSSASLKDAANNLNGTSLKIVMIVKKHTQKTKKTF